MVPLAERLVDEYRVFAPDLPGFGKSDRPPWALDVPGLADALADWHRGLDLDRSNLVGNSLGCQIIADLAARYPELANRIVLIGPTVDPLARSLLNQAVRQAVERPREPLSLTTLTIPDYRRAGLLRMLRMARYAVADRIEEKLPLIEAPTLIIRGTRDPISPQRWVEQMVRLLPNGRLVVVPGAPHSTQYSHPDVVAALVREFFEVDPASAGAPSATREGGAESPAESASERAP